MYTKEQQLKSNRIKKKNKNFSPATKQAIFERDNWSCVRCGKSRDLEAVPHHIIFKSQGGTGEKRNGITLCVKCHKEAHTKDSVRRWCETWRDENLDMNGDRL